MQGLHRACCSYHPVMVALMMTCVFHERLTVQTVVCLFLALAGIWLLYRDENGATLSAVGTVMVFLSALTYAVYIVYVSRSSLNAMPTVKVTFYVLLFGSFVFGARLLWGGEVLTPVRWYMWGNLLALAFFQPLFRCCAPPAPSTTSARPLRPYLVRWNLSPP